MFKSLPMKRIELSLLKDDAPQAALLLANHGSFNPEFSETTPEQFPELPGETYRLAYTETQSRLDKIMAHFSISAPDAISTPIQLVTMEKLTELDAWLKEVWNKCSEAQERAHKLRDDYRHTRQLLTVLDQFMDLNIDLTLLQKESRVMNIHVGTLPRANIQRFEEAIGLAGYVAIRFFTGLEHEHLIIAGPTGQAHEVESVLQAAGWRTTDVPAEFHGRPAEVRENLTARLAHLDEQQAHEEEQRRAAPSQEGLQERLFDAAHTLARAAPYAELATLMRGRGNLVTVSGWIPKNQESRLQGMLKQAFNDCFALHARDPSPEERMQVPSLISHHRWLRPFTNLVLNYGVPRYGEIDPTILFAVSYVLMFGMMFGDVGHGAAITLAALLLRKRFCKFAPLGVAAGISSMCFGLLYGSVFGFEQVLPALWMSPLSNPLLMLGIALCWGAGFILLTTMLSIRNRIADGCMREAMLDSHGAAGMFLYLGLLLGAYRLASTGHLDIFILLVFCIALATILINLWQHNRSIAAGERTLIVLVEGFEAVMAYISNTLSFLRLAAFSLNHVALSIAIFTVASMMHTAGYWLTIVLGNIFIFILEGAIVAIQVLRLEYYEGFSRFFGGDGRPFRALTLGSRQTFAL